MKIQLANNKYQLQIIDLNININELTLKLNSITEENNLFKNNIIVLQSQNLTKDNLINNLLSEQAILHSDNFDVNIKIKEKESSSQIFYHQVVKTIENLIVLNNSLQDKIDLYIEKNKQQSIKYNQIKTKYQNTLCKLEENNIEYNNIIDKNKTNIDELNLYKELNLSNVNDNNTLRVKISNHIDEITNLNNRIFDKDNYLKSMHKKYINEKPINNTLINNELIDTIIEPIKLNIPIKMSFKRGIKMSNKA